MAFVRVAVALLIPEPVAGELDVLRRALGESRLERLATHITVASPVNLRGPAALAETLAILRRAVGHQDDPLAVLLGPVTSFEPETPTIHLAVQGDLERLAELRAAILAGPLNRAQDRPFIPHVTLLPYADAELVAAARHALAGYRAETTLHRLALLVEEPGPKGRAWRTLADIDFGGVRVVGRGGLEVELTSSSVIDPEAAQTLAVDPVDAAGAGVVVTARREAVVVGVAWNGRCVTAPEAAGHGIDGLLESELAWRLSRMVSRSPR